MRALIVAMLLLVSSTCVAGQSTYRLTGAITAASVEPAIQFLKDAEDAGVDRVTIAIDSPGGSVMAGWALIHAIERSNAVVTCAVDGLAASMAFVILESCDVRTATARSILMAHEVATGDLEGPIHETEARNLAERLRVMTYAAAAHCAARMGIPVGVLLGRMSNGSELWLSAADALRWHAIDGIR